MPGKTEEISKETIPEEGASISSKKDVAYELISRNLAEKDLRNTAVVKLIINDRDRLQAENTELKGREIQLHQTDKENGILKEKFKTFTAFEIISTGTISVGSLISGYALNINPADIIILVVGILLIIVGIFAKTIKLL